MAISPKLKNKNAREKANIKGQEIAKLRAIPRTQRDKYEIEIVETRAIDNGVEVFARAWQNGKQIGFGKDGSVDIERFRIINPPILVSDESGDIVRDILDPDTMEKTGERKLKEDPQEALLQVLEHNLSVMKNIHTDERIVRGKRGNTTTTVYPDAGDPGTTSIDGEVKREFGAGTGESWSTIRDGAGNGKNTTGNLRLFQFTEANTAADEWEGLLRAIVLFDTSSIADTDTVTSATMSFWVSSIADPDTLNTDVNIYTSTPASNTTLANADYGQIGTTPQSTAMNTDDMTTGAYNDFTLNATGRGNISKTGVSKFATRNAEYDVANVSPPAHGQAREATRVVALAADETGTSNDPKLVIEHSEAPPFTPKVMIF